MKSDDGAMRVRTKDCYACNDAKEVLYRCRYEELKDWVFLCGYQSFMKIMRVLLWRCSKNAI